jgi:hypothetical protein
MFRPLLLCLPLLLASCLIAPRHAQPSGIAHIALYGLPLGASTKISIPATVMQDSNFYLSKIVEPEQFLTKLHRALAGKQRAGEQAFDFSDVRMVYRLVDRTNKASAIVLSRGGWELSYNGYVYRVDEDMARVIAEYLPERESLRSEEDRRFYKKKQYTPLECCR